MDTTVFPYQRMVVIGSTGSGKSTLAGQLAQKLTLDRIELDALYWEPNWVGAAPDVFRARVERATRAPAWALAGNYRATRDIVWPRAEAVLWLDYPFLTIFRQLLQRTWRRWRTQEELWNGNRESMRMHLKLWSDDSLFFWLVKTYGRRRREYPELFLRPENRHLKVMRFAKPVETLAWLDQIQKVAGREI
jgi:adenylate kinase family enzyme